MAAVTCCASNARPLNSVEMLKSTSPVSPVKRWHHASTARNASLTLSHTSDRMLALVFSSAAASVAVRDASPGAMSRAPSWAISSTLRFISSARAFTGWAWSILTSPLGGATPMAREPTYSPASCASFSHCRSAPITHVCACPA